MTTTDSIWAAAEHLLRRDAEELPPSYFGGSLVANATTGECVVRMHFGDVKEAERWFDAVTDSREAAQKAAPAQPAQQPDMAYAELADKLQYGSVAFGSDGEWVSIRRYIRDEAVAALRAAHGQAPAPTTAAQPPAVPQEWITTVRKAHQLVRAHAFDMPDGELGKAMWDEQEKELEVMLDVMLAVAPKAEPEQVSKALSMRISDTGRVSVDPGALANSPEFLAQVAAVKRLRDAQAAPQPAVQHPDDVAVDALAALMKAKLAKQRAKGYGGWDDPACKREWLSALLREHVDKGDPVDVANFCAFLSARGWGIAPTLEAAVRDFEQCFPAPQPTVQQGDDAAALNEIADIFQIGSEARKDRWCILENVRNSFRREQCLSRIEHSYFTVPRPPDEWEEDDEGAEECLLNWGDEPDEYAKRFGEALAQMAAPAPVTQGDALTPAARDVLVEVKRATVKFPTWPTDPLHALAVLGEEFGELTKDMLQLTYEPHKTSTENVRTEAIQTAAMALRLCMSLDRYEYRACAQHHQDAARAQAKEGAKHDC